MVVGTEAVVAVVAEDKETVAEAVAENGDQPKMKEVLEIEIETETATIIVEQEMLYETVKEQSRMLIDLVMVQSYPMLPTSN